MSVATRKLVEKGGEDKVVRILNRHPEVNVRNDRVEINANHSNIGNGTWGHISYLVNHCGYSRIQKQR